MAPRDQRDERYRRQHALFTGQPHGPAPAYKGRQRALPSRWCCPTCRRDVDSLRRNPESISERIEEIADVLHGYTIRHQNIRLLRGGRRGWRAA